MKRYLFAFLLSIYVLCAGSEELKVNDAGTWRNVRVLQINDAGTWRRICQVQVNDAGTWRTSFRGICPQLSNRSVTGTCASSCTASAQIYFSTDESGPDAFGGALFTIENFTVTSRLPEWWGHSVSCNTSHPTFPFCGFGLEMRLTVNSGSSPTAGSNTVGSWIPMGGFWFIERSTVGTTTGNWTVEIRDSTSLTVLATGIYTMTATVT